MKRFKKILFVNESSSKSNLAAHRAAQLARENGAALTVCEAIAELPESMAKLEKEFKQVHENQLQQLLGKLNVTGLNVQTMTLVGIPFIEIIWEVQKGKYDLVIKSAEGSSGMFSNLFGETDMSLMRKCPCPVWIVKPSSRKKYARIVAAVDPDPAQSANAELNEKILNLATSLARQENSRLHIVHSWELVGEDVLKSKLPGRAKLNLRQLSIEKRKIHQDWLDNLLQSYDLDDIESRTHLIKGNAGKVIPYLVNKQSADLVVMGTVARTGIEGFVIGNTAEKILRNVDCSVLTVKPERFKSRIKN